MQPFVRHRIREIASLVAALLLAACSGSIEKISEAIPRASDFSITGIELNPYSKASMAVAPTFKPPPVSAADYINADGSCAGEGEQSTVVGLTMTECAAVRALGAPQQVNVGANDRGERLVKLTYLRGDRPGLYVFTAGRLTEIERVFEPAPPPKPQRQPAKPRRAAT